MRAKNSGLLPAGFEDLLPPDAEAEYDAIASLMSVFKSFGYERVKPPIAEFEESLFSSGVGSCIADDTFRVMDPKSRKMLALRSDITAQIARIATSRLSDERRPLRLTYANDVIRTESSQYRTQRQFTQVGCEIVGVDNVHADIEAAVVALKALSVLGLPVVTIDFSYSALFHALMKITDAGESEIDVLRSQFAGNPEKVFDALGAYEFSDEDAAIITRLKGVVDGVSEAVEELELSDFVNISVDPLETQGFEYHDGVSFTFFAQGVRGVLGRGGRYKVEGSATESAVGFTFYMDTVRCGLLTGATEDVVEVGEECSWREVAVMQAQGKVIKRKL